MVYLIDLQTCYKIGSCSDINKRIKSFKNSREDVKVIDLIVNPKKTLDSKEDIRIERDIQELCSKYLITRELFMKDNNVVSIFRDYKYNIIKDNTLWEINETNKNNVNQSKSTYQYDMLGNLINIYKSTGNAATLTGISRSCIQRACTGESSRAGNFIWSYNELDTKELEEKINKAKLTIPTKIQQFTKSGDLIGVYDSISDAFRATGVKISSISLCINGKYKTAGGFIWSKQ